MSVCGHLPVFRAVRCTHVSKPLARSVGDIAAVWADTFQHSGALLFDSIRRLQFCVRILAENGKHWQSPCLEFVPCDCGCHLALKPDSSSSVFKRFAMPCVWVNGVNPFVCQDVQNSARIADSWWDENLCVRVSRSHWIPTFADSAILGAHGWLWREATRSPDLGRHWLAYALKKGSKVLAGLVEPLLTGDCVCHIEAFKKCWRCVQGTINTMHIPCQFCTFSKIKLFNDSSH